MRSTGIISALRAEAACLTSKAITVQTLLTISDDLTLIISGMGEKNVARALDESVRNGAKSIVSFGTAGALDNDLNSGDLILAREILNSDKKPVQTSDKWRNHILKKWSVSPFRVFQRNIYSDSEVATDGKSKELIAQNTAADAIDMESALIADFASIHNIPCLILRVIVDEKNMSIPKPILEITDEFGDVSIFLLFTTIIRNPGLLPDLVRLGIAFRNAKKTMSWIGAHLTQIPLPE